MRYSYDISFPLLSSHTVDQVIDRQIEEIASTLCDHLNSRSLTTEQKKKEIEEGLRTILALSAVVKKETTYSN